MSESNLQGLNLPPLAPRKLDAWVGIDPGKSGALAIIDEEGRVKVFDYEEGYAIKLLIEASKMVNIKLACLEEVSARPIEGRRSVLSNGKNFGIWEGALIALQIPYQIVKPQVWQAKTVNKADGKTTKQRSMAAAKRLFPKVELFGPKGGKRDGRADALLIMIYCKSRFFNHRGVL